jgi:hypothetical protein
MPDDLAEKASLPDDIDVQFVEKTFSEMEGWLKGLFDDLLTEVDSRGAIPRPLRMKFAPYIIVQLLRTRLYRELLLEMTVKTREALANAILEKTYPEAAKGVEIKVEFDRSVLPVLHAQRIFDEDHMVELASIINRHIWLVGINNTIQPFYTSDHPVVKKANREQPGRSFNGLRSPGIEIAFPLSSRRILVMLERSHFRHLERFDGRTRTLDVFGVERYNVLQVMKCRRQVYCETNQFEQADGVCRRFPALCVHDRSRVQIVQTEDELRTLVID